MLRRVIISFGRINPVELPIFFSFTEPTSRGSAATFLCAVMTKLHYTFRITKLYGMYNVIFGASAEAFQFFDQYCDHSQPAVPEFRIAGVEAEWSEQLGMVLGAAGRKHRQIALGKTIGRVLVNGVERIPQAIAECVSINVERRMDEMRDVGPECLVTGLEFDRRPETFVLHRHP